MYDARDFEEGDKVQIRSRDDLIKEFGIDNEGDIRTPVRVNRSMQKYCGEKVTISAIDNDRCSFKNNSFIWSPDVIQEFNVEIISDTHKVWTSIK